MSKRGLKITLGSHEFNGDTGWTLDLPAGWWDGPEMDVDLLPTIGEGSARGRTMVRHRTIIGDGSIVARDPEAHAAAHATIEALVPIYDTTPLVVHEATGAKQLAVSALQPTRVRCYGDTIEFQLTLVATDPHKQPVEEP